MKYFLLNYIILLKYILVNEKLYIFNNFVAAFTCGVKVNGVYWKTRVKLNELEVL